MFMTSNNRLAADQRWYYISQSVSESPLAAPTGCHYQHCSNLSTSDLKSVEQEAITDIKHEIIGVNTPYNADM